jgi:hypothetical protein
MTNIKTIEIKEKLYVPVVERVKEFHRLHPDGEIRTEIVNNDEKRIIVKATVSFKNELVPVQEGVMYAHNMYRNRTFTGFSQAEWGKGMMGGVALEVAETSAIGRALGFANIGLIDGIASADEMRKVDTKKGMQGDDGVGF